MADAQVITSPQAAGEKKEEDLLTYNNLKNYYVNDGPKAIWIIIFVLCNAACFFERFYHYGINPKQGPLLELFGWGLPIARGAALPIKFNSAILLMTVLRNFLSFLRTTWVSAFIPLDKNIQFHKGIAWVILFFALLHTGSHYINYYRLSTVKSLTQLKPLGSKKIPAIFDLAWGTMPGVSGHLLLIIMALMYSSAIVSIRRPYFEAFWYTHHLFILFYILLCTHGLPGVLEPTTAYFYVLGPMCFYALERGLRIKRGNEDTVLAMAVMHPSQVIELRMKKTTFKYRSGEYLFLNCPFISSQEWHPFTITSAPEQDFVSVHVRIVGDWTTDLKNLLNPNNELGIVAEDIATASDGRPILRIDGPFGTASEEVFNFKTVVLVGGGIGVTPFASILRSVRYKTERQNATGIAQLPLKKVYFFWISRDKTAFEWFAELLGALEENCEPGLIDINIYLTGDMRGGADAVKKTIQGDLKSDRDAVTGLQARTHYGRPNWNVIFGQFCQNHPNEEVGVFFCGPAPISKALYQTSRQYTMSNAHGTKFKYNKENF